MLKFLKLLSKLKFLQKNLCLSEPKFYRPYGIGVATGEVCANRVMFKQFLQAGAMQFCQIDSARMGGINEILAVYFMAKKLNGSIFDLNFFTFIK